MGLRPLAAVALLALAAGLGACSPVAPGAAVELRSARLTEAGVEREIALPDAWESGAPARRGSVRYRLELPDAALRGPQSALFVPRVGNAYRIDVNGQSLLAAGSSAPRDGEPPLLLPLPQALLAPSGNRLEIEVSGESRREAGLSPVWVGPLAELSERHAALSRDQVVGARVVSSAATVMGALALLLAWRTRRSLYACFGAASLLWAWRVSGMQLGGADSAWAAIGTVVFHASYAWFALLMTLYALAAVGRDSPAVCRLLAGWAALALALSAGAWVFGAPLLRTLVLAGTLLNVLWLLTVLARAAWRERTPPAVLLSAVAAIAVVVGARDFWLFRVLGDYGAPTWSRYTILLLLAVLAWLLVDEFSRSTTALRALNTDLQERVAQKERELQGVFDGRREHEREQAVLAERDRILREMHDGLGGRLVAAMALTSQVERQSLPPPGGASRSVAEPLRDLKLTLDDCLVELRLALDSLETDQRPLIEALAELRFRVEPSLRAAGVRLVWQIDDAASEVELPAAETLHVLRIVREALTNVIKHAQATVVWLKLESAGEQGLLLSVVDNGLQQRTSDEQPGLPLFVPTTLVHGGRGLANMQRRAAALQARLDSGPHAEGWAVTLRLQPRRAA